MFYEGLDAQEKANKAALLLAYDQFHTQLNPFVKGSARRLAYVEGRVDAMLEDVSEKTGADLEYVKDRFAAWLREAVPSKLPEDSYKIKNEEPPVTVLKTDITDPTEVEGAGRDEALQVDDVVDLSEYTKKGKCFRCGKDVESKIAKRSATCLKCTMELHKLAGHGDDLAFTGDDMYEMYGDQGPDDDDMAAMNNMWDKDMSSRMDELKRQIEFTNDPDERSELFEQLGELQWKLDRTNTRDMSPDQQDDYYEQPSSLDDYAERGLRGGSKQADMSWSENGGTQPNYSDPSQGLAAPADPNMQYVCTICGRSGTHDEIMQHVNQDHADVLQRQQELHVNPGQQQQMQPNMGSKNADVTDGQNPAEVQPLQETPGDHFDDIVNDLAAQAAARHFSLPTEDQIHSIASQLGLPADEVKDSLVSVATFGNYVGMNGQLGGDGNAPEGYEPIQVQGNGSSPQTAKVPTNLVVQKVADDMNMETDLAYSMIRDKYGADLPETYHAQVQGQQSFYLPSELAQNQAQQPQEQQQPVDPSVGPAFQQTPPGAPVQQQPQAQPGQLQQQ